MPAAPDSNDILQFSSFDTDNLTNASLSLFSIAVAIFY